MYLMYADEADQDGSKEFLVYAAVFFPAEKVLELHNSLVKLRYKYGFKDADHLKFSTGTKPPHVSRDDHTNIKNDILDLAIQNSCQTCCYVIPHAIAKGRSHEDRLKFGINTLLMKFDQFLSENGCCAGSARFDHTTDFINFSISKKCFRLELIFKDVEKNSSELFQLSKLALV